MRVILSFRAKVVEEVSPTSFEHLISPHAQAQAQAFSPEAYQTKSLSDMPHSSRAE